MGQSTTAGEVRQVALEAERKYGLPEGTLYKMVGIESSFNPQAVSPKGARGWLQFMPATASEYGLDDPTDLRKAVDAGGRKMRDLMAKHRGNLDFALVDYNGGGKAVRALMEGKPWRESAGYLTKFHGKALEEIESGFMPSSMGRQFTSQTAVSPTDGPNVSELANAQRADDDRNAGAINFVGNLPRAVSLGFETQNTVWNYYQDKALAEGGESLDWDSPVAQDTLKQFPHRYWDYLLQAGTTQGLEQRSARLRSVMDKEQELSGMGVAAALTGGIAGGLPDLPTLIGFLPVIGGAGLMTKAGRLANAARLGGAGMVSNVAIDAVANQYKPTATPDDLYYSALFGLGLGALAGGSVNPRNIRLREENLRLRNHGIQYGTKGLRKEIDEVLPPPPAGAPVVPGANPRDEWLKKIDEWAGGLGVNPPQKPRMAILSGGPDDLPAGPRTVPGEAPPAAPKVPRTEPPEAPAVPGAKPWGPEFDQPVTVTRMGAKDILLLPPLSKISHLAEYVRTYSKNPDMVALMDRALKGLDLRKIKFNVIDPNTDPRTLQVSARAVRYMDRAYGVVLTPNGSRGEGIELALRGRGYGTTNSGLNEETFVHEVLHAATVYKWHRVSSGNTEGMRRETIQAFRELDKLYREVKDLYQAFKGTDAMSPEMRSRGDNFMENSREFISYGLTNRPFQEWLKTVEIGGTKTTLWTRFTESLRKLLGMSKTEGSAYAKLIDLTEGLLDKSGVEGKLKTRADLEAGNGFIDTADVEAANAANLPTVFGIGLGLEHRIQGKKAPPAVRDLASKLIGTTVGYKGHAVVKRNAWDDTIAKSEGWTAEARKTGYTAFQAWFKESKRPFHQKGQAFEEFGEQVSNYVRGFEGDFHPEVRKAGDKLRELYGRVVDEVNNPALSEGGSKRGLTEVEMLDDTGKPVLVGKLEKNPNYMPRKHDARKWDEAVRTWGREAVESWWANAYLKAHPERTAEDAKKWAGWYARTVEEAHMNRSTDHLEEMMSGYDEKALKESLIRNGGFSEREADDIIRGMFQKPSSDAGRTASSLRHRNTISETHAETWKTRGGEEVEITINDFIRSNAFDVSESYFRRTASSIALANRLDIYKQSEIGRMIDEATAKTFGADGISEADALKMRNDLKFAFDRVQGIPQEEWTSLNKGFEMWRDFNVIRLMGGAVWNQVTELAQIVGSMGWKATLGAVPELRALRRDIRSGKAPNDLLDHLENTIGGAGSEFVARMQLQPGDDWVRYKGDTAMNRRLDTIDTGLKKAAKGVLDYTGMTGVMVQQKRIHAIALANHFVNAATGTPSKYLTKERLAWMGMSEADYANLNEALKKYAKGGSKGSFGAKVDFDIKKFAAEQPEAHSMLMNALHRESRRVIQENDLASMVPLMGSTLGKTVFQFMNFVIHGWNKSMLFAMNHRDFATLSTVLHGSLFASLAYMGRTQLGAMGMEAEQREEYLAKRMSGQQIVANGFGRISQASLLPTVFDTISPVPMFAGMRTTSDISSFASNPTYQAINGLLSTRKIVRNAFSDEFQTTERDVRTWGKLVPLNNVAPISTLLNGLAGDYPYSETED